MIHRTLTIASAALVLVVAAGCGKSEPPKKAEAPKTEAAPATPPVPVEAPKPPVPTAGQPPAAEAKSPAEEEAAPPKPGEEAAPTIDKEKLSKCYTAVYCAQKKGEMDKILGIYKEYGFDTPQSFTKTWIEAAKDTDWVTKIAHEVGKKCP